MIEVAIQFCRKNSAEEPTRIGKHCPKLLGLKLDKLGGPGTKRGHQNSGIIRQCVRVCASCMWVRCGSLEIGCLPGLVILGPWQMFCWYHSEIVDLISEAVRFITWVTRSFHSAVCHLRTIPGKWGLKTCIWVPDWDGLRTKAAKKPMRLSFSCFLLLVAGCWWRL